MIARNIFPHAGIWSATHAFEEFTHLVEARFVIDRIKQDKNIENLKIEIRKLLDNVAMIFKESQEVGKLLNKALISQNKLNKNLI